VPHPIVRFLTCEPNGVVAPTLPKAMLVILSEAEAQALPKPLPDELMLITPACV
jgi:hypothetical protein